MKQIIRYILILLALQALCSCIKEELKEIDTSRKEFISFRAAITAETRSSQTQGTSSYLSIVEEEWPLVEDDKAKTRGSYINALDGLKAGMYAFPITDGTAGTAVMTRKEFEFINNEELDAVEDPVMWTAVKNADSVLVYGYAPYAGFEPATTSGKTVISYTSPTDLTKQIDIIASDTQKVPKDYCQDIPLAFKHILTGVRFQVGFSCTVESLEIQGVSSSGSYTIGDAWDGQGTTTTYALPIGETGRTCEAGAYVTTDSEIFLMIPQVLPDGAKVVMTYDSGKTLTASLKGLRWDMGALVTYTIHETLQQEYVYFDLHAGNVGLTPTSYKGWVYVNGEAKEVSKSWKSSEKEQHQYRYYVYQSTDENKADYGYESEGGQCRIPAYPQVKVGKLSWSEYITNNTSVEDVIETWDDGKFVRKNQDNARNEKKIGVHAVRDAGRGHTSNYIKVSGANGNYDLTIDNIYSIYHDYISGDSGLRKRNIGGITYVPTGNSTLTVNLIGDSRLGCVHIQNQNTDKIIFEGSGSLTAANADFITPDDRNYWDKDYYGTSKEDQSYIANHRKSAIGNDTASDGHIYGLIINSGVIYAGTTKIENCSAIGGGGNGFGQVTINGGVVTAVATTTGTAIGGGIGFTDVGGKGEVVIKSGSIYAYNFANRWGIPSSAIGGGGSRDSVGKEGIITINGGYIYAYSALGTAIGGGSSAKRQGGEAIVTITGGYIIARSDSNTSIGGGSGGTDKASDKKTPAYGGSATIKISGNPVIRTGSIGGGDTQNTKGKIGHAEITIAGGDISAQFVMSGGADATKTTKFTMTGGTVSNSDVDSKEYYHVKKNGGAVYMEDGEFKMSGGTISNCSSNTGGAVYIAKSDNANKNPSFTMSGGTIRHCESKTDGGAVYLKGGSVTMTGGNIESNLAQNGNGGGLYIAAGDFSMSGSAKISHNSVLHRSQSDARANIKTGNGGGVYVTSPSGDVNVTVASGRIQNNTCDQNGGGLCVDMATSTTGANSPKAIIRIGMNNSGPDISSNNAGLYGGGLYAIGQNAMITIDGGRIQENYVTNYVPNENVANELGTVLLNNGDVPYKTVRFDVNTDSPVTISHTEQKIVTATNSALDAPLPTRENYNFIGWNIRKDGKGSFYETGDIMNLTEDLTLYAQWKSQ